MAVVLLNPTASAYIQMSATGPGAPGVSGSPIGFSQSDISITNTAPYLNAGRAIDVSMGAGNEVWSAYDSCLLWDTSVIGPGTITGANLKFAYYVAGGFPKVALGGNFYLNWYLFDGTIAAADWVDFANLTNTPPSPIAATILHATWAAAVDQVIVTVALTNLSNINGIGNTGMRLSTGNGTTGWPVFGGGSQLDQLVIYSMGSGITAPQLQVTYTPSGLAVCRSRLANP